MSVYRMSLTTDDIKELDSNHLLSPSLRVKVRTQMLKIELGLRKKSATYSRDQVDAAGGIVASMYKQYTEIEEQQDKLLFLKDIDNENTKGKVCEMIMSNDAIGVNKEKWYSETEAELKRYIINSMMEYQMRKNPEPDL